MKFYDRCIYILNLFCIHLSYHEMTEAARKLKRDLYQNVTLNTFLPRLKEPLRTIFLCMKLDCRRQALQYAIQDENAQFFLNFTTS